MRQHKARVELAVDIDQPFHMRGRKAQRIIAGIEEFDLGAKGCRRAFGLVLAAGLDLRKRHARLLPGELGFPALAERQANDLDAVAFFGVKRDGPACPPDEIAGMCRYHQACFCHRLSSDLADPFFFMRRPSRRASRSLGSTSMRGTGNRIALDAIAASHSTDAAVCQPFAARRCFTIKASGTV